MGIKDGYIITDLSSSIQQRTLTGGAVVAPFGFGHRGLQNLRGTCQPYSSFPGSSMPDWDRGDCGVPDDTVKMLLITQDSPVYTPVTYGTEWYTEIVDAEVVGTSSTHVGSIYLTSGTLNEIGFEACTTQIPLYTIAEIRRFTDNSPLTSFNASAAKCGYTYNSLVSVTDTDWYDIYVSGAYASTTSSLEGIYVEYKI